MSTFKSPELRIQYITGELKDKVNQPIAIDSRKPLKHIDHLKTSIQVLFNETLYTEFWSSVGTIIYGNYIDDSPIGEKIKKKVFIVALENDKSCGISRKKKFFNKFNTFNTFKHDKTSTENTFNGIYEDFGGAVQIQKRDKPENSRVNDYVLDTLKQTAYNELKEETANLIDIDKDTLCNDNYIDYLMSPNDNFGRTRLYYIRLSDEVITDIINKNLIYKNYKRIIHNIIKLNSHTRFYFANYYVIKSISHMLKSSEEAGVMTIKYNNPTEKSNEINHLKSRNVLKKFSNLKNNKEFNIDKEEKKFSQELSYKIKSYLEVCDIGVIPFESINIPMQEKIVHPFVPGIELNPFIVIDIYGRNIMLDNRTGVVLYANFENNPTTQQFVKVDIMNNSKKLIVESLVNKCSGILDSPDMSIISLSKNYTHSNRGNNINHDNTLENYGYDQNFFLDKTVTLKNNINININIKNSNYFNNTKRNKNELYNINSLRNNSSSSSSSSSSNSSNK